jgi:hypothetical protein
MVRQRAYLRKRHVIHRPESTVSETRSSTCQGTGSGERLVVAICMGGHVGWNCWRHGNPLEQTRRKDTELEYEIHDWLCCFPSRHFAKSLRAKGRAKVSDFVTDSPADCMQEASCPRRRDGLVIRRVFPELPGCSRRKFTSQVSR